MHVENYPKSETINQKNNSPLSKKSEEKKPAQVAGSLFNSTQKESGAAEKKERIFKDLTHCMKSVKKNELDPWHGLNQTIDHIPHLEKGMQSIAAALNRGDWEDPIFQQSTSYPWFGLAAVREGLISANQFSTLMFYWSLNQEHPKSEIQIILLFHGDEINPVAFDMIKQTLQFVEESRLSRIPGISAKPALTDEQIKQFFQQMKEKPISEQQFFIVPDHFQTKPRTLTTIGTIIYDLGINVFSRCLQNGQPTRMVPSVEMMQNYLDVKYQYPVQIHPVIGPSSDEDIEQNGLMGQRDFAIPFFKEEAWIGEQTTGKLENNLPKEADSYAAPTSYDFMHHDFYHAQVASRIHFSHRQTLIHMAQIFKQMSDEKEFVDLKEFLLNSYTHLIDMDFYEYLSPEDPNNKERTSMFFQTLVNLPSSVMVRLQLKSDEKIFLLEDAEEDLIKTNCYKIFARNMLKNISLKERELDFAVLSSLAESKKASLSQNIIQDASGTKNTTEMLPKIKQIFKKDLIIQIEQAYKDRVDL